MMQETGREPLPWRTVAELMNRKHGTRFNEDSVKEAGLLALRRLRATMVQNALDLHAFLDPTRRPEFKPRIKKDGPPKKEQNR